MSKIAALASTVALSATAWVVGSTAAHADCTQPVGGIEHCEGTQEPAPQPEPQPQPQPEPQPGAITEHPDAAQRLLDFVNRDRAAAGLQPLAMRGDILPIANGHSRRMAEARNIWHNDEYFTERVRSSLNAQALAENVAMNSSVDNAHTRLMNSPGHRANILDGRMTHVGFAVAKRDGVYYVTQNFMQAAAAPRRPVVTAPAAASTPKAAPKPAAPKPAAPKPAPKAAPAAAPAAAPVPSTTPAAPAAAPAPVPADVVLETTPQAATSLPVPPADTDDPSLLLWAFASIALGMTCAGAATAAVRRQLIGSSTRSR